MNNWTERAGAIRKTPRPTALPPTNPPHRQKRWIVCLLVLLAIEMPKSVRVPVIWVDLPIGVRVVAAFCMPIGKQSRAAQRDLSRLKTSFTPAGSSMTTIRQEMPTQRPMTIIVFAKPILRVSLVPIIAPAKKEVKIIKMITASSTSALLVAPVSTKKAMIPLPMSVARPVMWDDLSKRSDTVVNAFK